VVRALPLIGWCWRVVSPPWLFHINEFVVGGEGNLLGIDVPKLLFVQGSGEVIVSFDKIDQGIDVHGVACPVIVFRFILRLDGGQ